MWNFEPAIKIEGYSGDLMDPKDSFGRALQMTIARFQGGVKDIKNIADLKNKLVADDYKQTLDFVDRNYGGTKPGVYELSEVKAFMKYWRDLQAEVQQSYQEKLQIIIPQKMLLQQSMRFFFLRQKTYKEAYDKAGGETFWKKVMANDPEANELHQQMVSTVIDNMTDDEREQFNQLREALGSYESQFPPQLIQTYLDAMDGAGSFAKAIDYALEAANNNFADSPPANDMVNQYYKWTMTTKK